MSVFGIPVFEEVSVVGLCLLAMVYFAAFTIKGAFGYGAVPILVVFGALIVGPHHAVLLAAMSNLFTHIQFVPESLRAGDRRLAGGLMLIYLPTIAVGIWVFGRLEPSWLNVIMGGLMVLVVGAEALNLFRRFEEPIRRRASVIGPLLGAVSGLLVGIIGAGGVAFMSLYVKILCPEKRLFRATILLLVSFILVWRIAILGISGFITGPLIVESLILLPVSMSAGMLGTRVFSRMTNNRFFAAFQIVLLSAASFLMINAVIRVL